MPLALAAVLDVEKLYRGEHEWSGMTIAAAAQQRYAKRGPTGFLKPLATWAVLIGHRVVDVGVNARNARRAYKRWCKFAAGSEGMASGKPVT